MYIRRFATFTFTLMKKYRCILATIAIVLSFLFFRSSAAQNADIPGDANGDGGVNILDLTFIASHLGQDLDTADVNGDGTVNILDLVFTATKMGRSDAENTLIFGRGGDSLTLDPALVGDGESAKVCDMIYDTLIQYREDTTEIEPALATAWESSTDGRHWRFHLREDVKFHDGTLFTADAVVFSLTRPQAVYRDFQAEFINRITVEGPFIVVIELKTAFAPFINMLTGHEFSIVSPASVQKLGANFSNNPVGTGPFKFVRWDPNDQIVLVANHLHWTGRPAIDRLIFRSIPDNTDRLMELQNGTLHIMEFPDPNELPLIQADTRLEVLTQLGLNVGYLAMNMDKPPFDNPLVRLAINHVINKREIIERFYQGTGVPAKGPIPPVLWSYDDTIVDYEYDPKLAKQLLVDAGYPDGFETTLWALPVPRPYIPDGMALAEAITSDLRNIGINTRIVTDEWEAYLERTENGEHDMAMLGWISGGDPDNFFYYLLSKNYAEKPAFNIAFYRSDEMQDVLVRARTTTDHQQRIQLYREAQAIFHQDVPWVPLAHAQRLLVIDRRVQNLKLAPIGWKYIRSVSLQKP